jgi:hypothetical protein
MIYRLFQIRHVRRKGRGDLINNTVIISQYDGSSRATAHRDHNIPINSNCPSLRAGLRIIVALEDLERNALLSQTLSKAKPAEPSSDNQYIHLDR